MPTAAQPAGSNGRSQPVSRSPGIIKIHRAGKPRYTLMRLACSTKSLRRRRLPSRHTPLIHVTRTSCAIPRTVRGRLRSPRESEKALSGCACAGSGRSATCSRRRMQKSFESTTSPGASTPCWGASPRSLRLAAVKAASRPISPIRSQPTPMPIPACVLAETASGWLAARRARRCA